MAGGRGRRARPDEHGAARLARGRPGLDAASEALPWSRDSDFRDLARAGGDRPPTAGRPPRGVGPGGARAGSRAAGLVRAAAAGDLSPRAGRDGRDPPGSCSGSRRSRAAAGPSRPALVVLTAVDLWHLGHHRRVRPGPDPIPRGRRARCWPGWRAIREGLASLDASRNLPMVVGRGPGLGLPDARPARAGVADKPGPTRRSRTAPGPRTRGRRRRAAGDGDGSRACSTRSNGPSPGPDAWSSRSLPGWADARRFEIRPWLAGSMGRTGSPGKGPSLDVHRLASPGRAGPSLARPLDLEPWDDDPGAMVG